MKQRIRLTEANIFNMVKDAVKGVLNKKEKDPDAIWKEYYGDDWQYWKSHLNNFLPRNWNAYYKDGVGMNWEKYFKRNHSKKGKNKIKENVQIKPSIRLTESDLHKIIRESVKRVLREGKNSSYLRGYENGKLLINTRIERYGEEQGRKKIEDLFNDLLKIDEEGKDIGIKTSSSQQGKIDALEDFLYGGSIVESVINEEFGTDLNSYVPKKAFKMVDKVNVELSQLKQLTGDEYPEILDTSSGVEMFIQIISDVVIENGHLKWTEKGGSYHDWDKVSIEDWNLVRDDEVEGYWFDEYEFKDQISYLRSGIKKAIKYFKEYNPDWDDNDGKREKFIGDL